jgi:hypothetical protein
MEIEKEIIKPAINKSEEKQIVKIIICDFCEKELKVIYHCLCCGRDVCNKHMTEVYDYGDYSDKYCKICYNLIFNEYKQERENIIKKYDEDIDYLNEKIKAESLAEILF